jgi:hypothetical protein
MGCEDVDWIRLAWCRIFVNTTMYLSDPKISRNYSNCENVSFECSMKLGNSNYWGPEGNAQQEPVTATSK